MELQRKSPNHNIVDALTCYGNITVAKTDY